MPIVVLVALGTWARAQAVADAHFAYDANAPLQVKVIYAADRGGGPVEDITYASADGRTVSAYLVIPRGKGPFAGVIWGHWLMPGSAVANRNEFMLEACALAPAGVVSLLIDAPQARTGFKPAGNAALIAEQVVDLRRAVDVLLAQPEVDPKRIAYVGHSWDAGTGAILDAVDKRLAAFVFMNGPQSNRQYVLLSDSPRMVKLRQGADMAKAEQGMQANAWADPGSYASQLGPAPALFQYGLHDEEWVPLGDAKDYVAMAAGPKEVKFYEADHALNAAARVDRFEFLREHLGLGVLPAGALAGVPQTK